MQITSYPRGPMMRRPAPAEVPDWSLAPLEGRQAPALEGAHFRTPGPRLSAAALASARSNPLLQHVRAEVEHEYRTALEQTTDDQWRFEMAEGPAHRAGKEHFERLTALQLQVDPDGVLWRQFAPTGVAIPQPSVRRPA